MIGSGIPGLIGALVVTFGLLVVAVHLLKRLQKGASFGGDGVPLRLLKRVSIGPKQGVGLLQVDDRILVVSIAEGGARLLTELEEPVVRKVLDEMSSPARQKPVSFMRRILPIAVLLVMVTGMATRSATATPATDMMATAGAPVLVMAQGVPVNPQINIAVGNGDDELRLTGAVGLVVFIGFLTLLPAILLLMTSFTRILIILQFLKPAMGTQSTPPVQILVALSILLTGVVMHPVLSQVNETAIQPILKGEITQADAYKEGIKPFREFMLANTGDNDLALFTDLTGISEDIASLDEIPTLTVISAFVTSELRTAFEMGFLIFIPFIIVDLIVASVLMSLGMFMLPPLMISLPFKLLLFVLADGWTLVIKNVVLSFA